MIRHWNKNLIGIFLLGLIAFSPALKSKFVGWDDYTHIKNNEIVENFDLKKLFVSEVHDTYIPLTTLSFAIEYQIGGWSYFLFHLNNIILHLLISALIFFFIQELGFSSKIAWLTAILFCLHPMHVESVAWATERKDVLYSAFYMTALIFYTRYAKDGNRKNYWLALLAGFLSILSKPMALSLPFILFLIDWYLERGWSKKIFIEKILFFLVIETIALISFIGVHLHVGASKISWETPLLLIWTSTFYLKKFFIPFDFCPMYGVEYPISWSNPEYIVAFGLAIVIATSLVVGRKNRLWIFAVLFWLLSAFFLFRIDRFETQIVSDRSMYLPSLGFCLLTAYLIERLILKSKLAYGLSGLLICALFCQTYNLTKIWKDSTTLYHYTISKNPNANLALSAIGEMLYEENNKEAIKYLTRAIEVKPDSDDYFWRSCAYFDEDLNDLAWEDTNKALELYRNENHYLDGIWRMRSRIQLERYELDEAMKSALKAKHADPSEEKTNKLITKIEKQEEYFFAKGEKLYDEGKFQEAYKQFDRLLKADNKNLLYFHYRGLSLMNIDREEEAILDYKKALELLKEDKTSGELWIFKERRTLETNIEVALQEIEDRKKKVEPLAQQH